MTEQAADGTPIDCEDKRIVDWLEWLEDIFKKKPRMEWEWYVSDKAIQRLTTMMEAFEAQSPLLQERLFTVICWLTARLRFEGVQADEPNALPTLKWLDELGQRVSSGSNLSSNDLSWTIFNGIDV